MNDNVPNHPEGPRGDSAAIFRSGYIVAMNLAVSRVEYVLGELELVHRQLLAALTDRQREGGDTE